MTKRILIVHNAYQHEGGEDSVVDAEITLLRSKGHEVEVYTRHNDEIAAMSKLGLVGQTLWSNRTTENINCLINTFLPNVIHVHNTFPLISPSLYWAASKASIPVVQTLHNFRLLCPQAMFLRNGKVCEDCLGHIPWHAAMHGCYRGSKAQSTVVAGMVVMHRAIGTWQKKITRYIALNEFCRQKFIEGGLPADRIMVKPNFVDFKVPKDIARAGFLFVGRLSTEKGIQVLAKAAELATNASIRVAGTGSETSVIQGIPNVQLLGPLDGNGVTLEMSRAMALVLPSIWYENFPRTLVEAFACGLPVIASRLGALAELVQEGTTGLLFEAGNAEDLASKLRWAHNNPQKMLEMGKNARRQYESEFAAEKNYQQLIAIYQIAIDEVRNERLRA
jgi:glycosyltransferase involved in cell wall biosynthesis